MGMNTIIKKGIILSALALSAFCLFQARAGKGDTANEPVIINNEPVVYLDNTDQIGVQGEGVQSVAYSSSNKKIAKISQKGKITPKKKGTTTIRAKVVYQVEGQNRETTLSYSLKVLGKSKEYFIYLNNDPKRDTLEPSEIVGLTEAGKKLKDVYIPERYLGKKVELIHSAAFSDGSHMERLYISDYVKDMENSSEEDFRDSRIPPGRMDRGCNQLREVHLGKNVMHFGISNMLPRLEKITVAPGNKTYHVQDGVLFKKKETLTLYPAGKKDASYTIPKGITEIENFAFAWAKNLEKVAIPSGIKNLDETFQYSGLREIVLPEGLESTLSTFKGCANLEKAVIPVLPDNCTIVRTFEYCNNLKTVSMQNMPKGFAGDNFSGCSSLEKIQLPQDVKGVIQKDNVLFNSDMETLLLYPAGKKDKSYKLPDGVRKIHKSAFAGAQHLSEVILNKELREIGEMAFSEAKIKKIAFNDGLQRIGYSAFGDSDIMEAVLPDSVRTFESCAFLQCRKLRSVKLSSNIEELGNTFRGCSSLRTLHIPKMVKKIWSGAGLMGSNNMSLFQENDLAGCISLTSITVEKGSKYFTAVKGVLYNKSKTELIVYPAAKKDKKFSIPKSVKKISDGAFAGCHNIRELTMKDRVRTCGIDAFFYMSKLEKIRLSENLKKLDVDVLAGCRRLKKIRIPDKVRMIDEYTFDGCTSLKSIALGKNVKEICRDAFRDCESLQKVVFQRKIWSATRTPEVSFRETGKRNYGKLALHVPKKWKKEKKLILEWFREGGLSKKAKIKFY